MTAAAATGDLISALHQRITVICNACELRRTLAVYYGPTSTPHQSCTRKIKLSLTRLLNLCAKYKLAKYS